jgi:pyruvate/2-oxoglutarate dehydrogenase complex dihydrolipoamide dehydrogenase (E3) component
LADAGLLTNIELLELDRLPEHLVVLGGGYVGLEFAQAYRRFGSRVTVITHGEQLLEREDPDVSAELARILGGDGIDIVLAADVLHVEGRSGEGIRLRVRAAGRERSISASDILLATGHTPNTAGIGLDLAGARRSTRDRLIPYCLFTDPPLAHVGLSEREARQRGIATRVATLAMAEVLIGPDAGEVMAVVQTAMLGGLPYTVFRDAILAHPTMAEGLSGLFTAVPSASTPQPHAASSGRAASLPG